MQGKGLERKKHDFPYNEINKKQSKKGVIMPMSLSHKSVKKHNKKLPANVTNHKMVPVQERWIFTFQAAPPWCILESLKSGKEFLHLLY